MSNRFKMQDRLADPENNISGSCTEAALASFFDVSLASIGCLRDGNIALTETPQQVHAFWERFESVFNRLGYEMLRRDGNYVPDCLYLASGRSPRGLRHMVLMRGGVLVHDPHPEGGGVHPIDHVYLAVPKDAGKCMVFHHDP